METNDAMPEWTRRFLYHRKMARIADRGIEAALRLRCFALESGGARCTADAEPAHAHRYDLNEIPATHISREEAS